MRWRYVLLSLWQSPVHNMHRRIYLRSRRQTIMYHYDGHSMRSPVRRGLNVVRDGQHSVYRVRS